ncbi:group II intron reverse transcriptase/maturase [Pseudenhygromyxa sp. WMMC2535]|uniref:group II intron reverse transcriptase/maturase n=1 Tax=Pseudenhygromyxa sp. WMMC2535 TaxID=2712867 RepID=UPI001554FFC5|nr:group II intron reverse transcriptase/maturase [Pseudenhygromyxa sp. WMMC2535]
MKESNTEGVATHGDPEPCVDDREVSGEALTGARAGRVLSREIRSTRGADAVKQSGRPHAQRRQREELGDPARSETPRTHGTSLRENREISTPPERDGGSGRTGKAVGHTPVVHGMERSDGPIVPTKPPNDARRAEEVVEGRGPTKGNTDEQNVRRTQCRGSTPSALDRVREAARKDKKMKFTALFHHVTLERLRASYYALRRRAAPGTDGVTWAEYGQRLEDNLRDLLDRLHRGAYRGKPTRRVYIPKPGGRQRPLGIASLEDKIVQRAVVEVLNAIYETDFLGFSYGFRPGRSPHQALDALATGVQRRKVNWVLDADIRGFFDAIDHEWMIKFVEHRIADKRIVRLLRKWLKAGILEQGEMTYPEGGTPQGATISPLLANIYLHYVLDLWAQQWRKRHAVGEMIIVRYADDFVVGFQRESDAKRFQNALRARLHAFELELHPDKTRLLRFGRCAAAQRRDRGEGRPETFEFLGFIHICGKSRRGRFLLLRHTSTKRMRAKLKAIGRELMRRRHHPLPAQGAWLARVLRGHLGYYAVPTNIEKLGQFCREVVRLWLRALRRRSQRHRLTWERMKNLAGRWLPRAQILHPWPTIRFDANTRGRSPVR